MSLFALSSQYVLQSLADVHVWLFRLNDHWLEQENAEETLMHQLLAPVDLERRNQIRVPHARRLYSFSRALLRFALYHYTGIEPHIWQFQRTPLGRPLITYPTGSGLYFSISHTKNLVGCAFSLCELMGLDLERKDRQVDAVRLSKRFFDISESSAIAYTPQRWQNETFLRYWVLKESYLKAIGQGLHKSLSYPVFSLHQDTVTFCPHHDLNEIACDWSFRLFDASNQHLGAVAIKQKKLTLTAITLSSKQN